MNRILHKALMMVVCMSFASAAFAQRYQSDYRVLNNRVQYQGKDIIADAKTFEVLGFGYAKDRINVYLDDVVLKYVDPTTFRLQPGINAHRGHGTPNTNRGHGVPNGDGYRIPRYVVSGNVVMFNGHKVEGIKANSFKDLNDGYAKDAYNVYYMGNSVPYNMVSSSFKNLGYGYARDNFDVLYEGKKISGASCSTFKVLDYGYAKDAFSVYFEGQKVKGASASSFVVDKDGYAHDFFNSYYWGVKI